MNSLLKAARQALEALLSYEQYVRPLTDYFGGPEVPREGSTSAKVEDAITALRAAIPHSEDCWRWHHECAAIRMERIFNEP